MTIPLKHPHHHTTTHRSTTFIITSCKPSLFSMIQFLFHVLLVIFSSLFIFSCFVCFFVFFLIGIFPLFFIHSFPSLLSMIQLLLKSPVFYSQSNHYINSTDGAHESMATRLPTTSRFKLLDAPTHCFAWGFARSRLKSEPSDLANLRHFAARLAEDWV